MLWTGGGVIDGVGDVWIGGEGVGMSAGMERV